MRCLFAGTPETAVPALRALVASEHEVIGVLTRPPARSGRGRKLSPSPVEIVADELALPVIHASSLRDHTIVAQIKELKPQIVAVVAYGAIIGQDLLDEIPLGWVNLHFSLLPAWRGAAPVQHALINGDEQTGTSVFQIEAGLDTGPIFDVETCPIAANETAGELLERLSVSGGAQLVRVFDQIASGTAKPITQSTEGITLAPRLGSADGFIDWHKDAQKIVNQVRGCTPSPGTWTVLPDQSRLKIAGVVLSRSEDKLAPGELLISKKQVLVGTGTVPVELFKVAPAGKSWMDAPAWGRGTRFESGIILGETK